MVNKVLRLKTKITKYIPAFIVLTYHLLINLFATLYFGYPSRKLIVIGVTGTKGKTSTSTIIYQTLKHGGAKVGLLTTADIRIDDRIIRNNFHQTMLGRGKIQKYLKQMVDAGCEYAIVETTSEGIRQFRALGIRYDSLVFTNLSPEHLVTHKTFAKYMNTKGRLFRNHTAYKNKVIDGKKIDRYVLVNSDDQNTDYFYDISESKYSERVLFGFNEKATNRITIDISDDNNSFYYEQDKYTTSIPGLFSIRNAVPAIFFGKRYLNMNPKTISDSLIKTYLPGRMELIGNDKGFTVILDYAHEPLSIASVFDASRKYIKNQGRLIAVAGAVGGGRWKYNARDIGKTASKYSDYVVFTDVDPFEDDPEIILNDVVYGAEHACCDNWSKEIDRRKAIRLALSMAREGDVVVITGKGSELTMEVSGGPIPWDEREIIKEEISGI